MKILLWFIYLIKFNLLQLIVHNSRNNDRNLQYLDSSIFAKEVAIPCKTTNDNHSMDPNKVLLNNLTDIPTYMEL